MPQSNEFAALVFLTVSMMTRTPAAAEPTAAPAVAEDAPRAITVSQDEAVRIVLTQWEKVGQSTDTLFVRLNRFCYDETFQVEKRCAGRFLIDEHGQWVLELERVRIGPDQKSRRKDSAGNPYALRSDEPSVFVCRREAWIQILPDEGKYQKCIGQLLTTEEWVRKWREDGSALQQFKHFMLGGVWLHFDYLFRRTLLQPVQADLLSRFDFQVVKTDGPRVWLKMTPKSGGFDARNFSSMQVIFDRRIGRPVAARCVFPAGNIELVYLFNEFDTNVPILRSQDPFHPDLSGYQGKTTVLEAE